MGVRSTATEETGFIYDSVTGMAIGEVWEDTEEMDAFLEYYTNHPAVQDLRILTTNEISNLRDEFHENLWIKS